MATPGFLHAVLRFLGTASTRSVAFCISFQAISYPRGVEVLLDLAGE